MLVVHIRPGDHRGRLVIVQSLSCSVGCWLSVPRRPRVHIVDLELTYVPRRWSSGYQPMSPPRLLYGIFLSSLILVGGLVFVSRPGTC